MADHFSLRWNNFHHNMSSGFRTLLMEDTLVDVTLAAEGRFVQAHRLVLSVCSPYFKNLFSMTPCSHPVVIMKDVRFKQLTDILSFMYQGEVNVHQEELTDFLKTAELLQIRGLAEQNVEEGIATTLAEPPCPQHSGFQPSSGPSTKGEQKERVKVRQMVRVTSEQRLFPADGTGFDRSAAEVHSRASVQKLVHQNSTAPVQATQMHPREGPTTSMFAGVPVKEELPDVPSDAEQEVETYEFLPSGSHIADVDLGDTPIILQDGGSGDAQVTEKDLWTAPPNEGGGAKKSSSRSLLRINRGGEKSVPEQPKITRPRRQRIIALNKIRRFLVTPKRSRRIAFARKMKRKKQSFLKSGLSSENVTDVSKQLTAFSRNAMNLKNAYAMQPFEQDPMPVDQPKIETSDTAISVNNVEVKDETLQENKHVVTKKHIKRQDTKKNILPIKSPKKKAGNASKMKVKAKRGKKNKMNNDPVKDDPTNVTKNKKMSSLKKAKRRTHINEKNSAADRKKNSSINRKKFIVVIAAKKTKSAVALARKMKSPVCKKRAIDSQYGSPENVGNGTNAHLRSNTPYPTNSAKDSNGAVGNGPACRHMNCVGCREGN